MRLIDADALEISTEFSDDGEYCWDIVPAYRIREAPTIDPESLRPKGKWVKDDPFLVCLNCESEIDIKNCLGVENRKNFCPNCGADMRGESDG